MPGPAAARRGPGPRASIATACQCRAQTESRYRAPRGSASAAATARTLRMTSPGAAAGSPSTRPALTPTSCTDGGPLPRLCGVTVDDVHAVETLRDLCTEHACRLRRSSSSAPSAGSATPGGTTYSPITLPRPGLGQAHHDRQQALHDRSEAGRPAHRGPTGLQCAKGRAGRSATRVLSNYCSPGATDDPAARARRPRPCTSRASSSSRCLQGSRRHAPAPR